MGDLAQSGLDFRGLSVFSSSENTLGKTHKNPLKTVRPSSSPAASPLRPVQIRLDDSLLSGRTPSQFLKSVMAYCDWRAGRSWRNSSKASERNHPDRDWYLNGMRAVADVFYADEDELAGRGKLHVAKPSLPPLDPAPAPLPASLLEKPRSVLVGMLMQLDPSLTDAKRLSRLSKEKLSAMILLARKHNESKVVRIA